MHIVPQPDSYAHAFFFALIASRRNIVHCLHIAQKIQSQILGGCENERTLSNLGKEANLLLQNDLTLESIWLDIKISLNMNSIHKGINDVGKKLI